ncbi:hypothetical protein BH747_13725 [Enterococcus villorum]|uniref:Uncharacterized protein n=1 Tax=Enterococcus villorum TaxID=112904 RepID=A0A1V8YGG3_9ENTE|nr:hypothetical protein BH747_13725 [Enterococcus villorum]OQO71690.1 hypothetical protein BH744_14165 [Enterococcus villorum]
MCEIYDRIGLMDEEIFEFEMAELENKFWENLGKKGLKSKEVELCLFSTSIMQYFINNYRCIGKRDFLNTKEIYKLNTA